MTTTFPLNWSDVTTLPSTSFSFHAGAGTGGTGTARRSAPVPGARRRAAARRSAGFIGEGAVAGPEKIVAQGARVGKSHAAGLRQVEPERLYEFLHGRREDPALAVEDGERAGEFAPLEPEHGERPLPRLLDHGRLRHDRDPVVDLDRALHGLDVVELHDGLDLELVLAEDLVDGLARRYVGVEPDELLAGKVGDGHLAALGERVLGVADDDEVVVPEGNHVDLADLGGKGHEPEVDAVVQDVLVDKVRASVLDADVDRGKVVEEPLDVGRKLVEPDRVDRRDPYGPAHHLLHLLELREEHLVGVEDLLRRFVDALALARQLELLLAAVDQERLEMALHGPRLLAHGRLGDAVQPCGLGKALGLHEVSKDFEVFNLHD